MSFYITQIDEKDWKKFLLGESLTGIEIEIIPSAGAILNAFRVRQNDGTINIIDGYINFEDFKANMLRGFKGAKLSPFACRIKDARFEWEGKTYYLTKFLLNGSAIHGLLYDAHFEVKYQDAKENSALLHLEYQFAGEDPGYPFPYKCEVMFQLEKENMLRIKTVITNLSDTDIPVADGWHPYFSFGGSIDDLYLKICSENMLEYDNNLVPTGKMISNTDFSTLRRIGDAHLDNGFLLDFSKFEPMCVLKDEKNDLQLEIYPDMNYPYLQVYTPDSRRSIAIENLSSAPDAFNNGMGLISLKPGETKLFMTTYKVVL